MKTNMYAIYDIKSASYGVPFFMGTVGAALRAFGDLATDDRSSINRHPEDYQLFQLGEFDDNKGTIVAISPLCLSSANEFVQKVVEHPPVPARAVSFEGTLTPTEKAAMNGCTPNLPGVK